MAPVDLPIGEFSRMTHLSVKTLHHYHDVGVLVPARIDSATGYRYYDRSQAHDAALIRRLRSLDMPIGQLVELLDATPAVRAHALDDHLGAMRAELARATEVVSGLRGLIEAPLPVVDIELRSMPACAAMVARTTTSHEQVAGWLTSTFDELELAVGDGATGPSSARYSPEFFSAGEGQVAAYVPANPQVAGAEAIAGGRYLVAVHTGPTEDLDRTYLPLGAHAVELGISLDAPIVERYISERTTEVWWPVD